ncbi:Actin- protein 6, partial [Coemansia erecta]
ETVSFRYWDMMDETYIMSAVKEQTCFVSQDFNRDQEEPAAAMRVDYVLPDFVHSKRGFVRGHGGQAELLMAGAELQMLPLSRERFAVPEALFHPSDVGIDHMGGIHNAVVQAVGACPPETQAVMLANIMLVGGSALLPGLRERLQAEIQAMSPEGAQVSIVIPNDDPATCAWQGGRLLAAQQGNGESDGWRISKQEFHEIGPDRTISHFNRFA